VRIVSKGGSAFQWVLRHGTFNILPMFFESLFTLSIYATIFSWKFMVIQLAAIFLYGSSTFYLTEKRAAGFKRMTQADNQYNQKATDSLINFETVKYFNAEKHE